jgi:hypothetical protein
MPAIRDLLRRVMSGGNTCRDTHTHIGLQLKRPALKSPTLTAHVHKLIIYHISYFLCKHTLKTVLFLLASRNKMFGAIKATQLTSQQLQFNILIVQEAAMFTHVQRKGNVSSLLPAIFIQFSHKFLPLMFVLNLWFLQFYVRFIYTGYSYGSLSDV